MAHTARPSPRMSARLLAPTAVLGASLLGHAAAPTLDHVLPVALAPGSSNVVTLVGKFDPWPPRFWSDLPGLVFQPSTNNGSVVVHVPSNAPAGVRFLRAFNSEGTSAPRFLVIDSSTPLANESEPNNDAASQAHPATPPVAINGRLDKSGDVDSFQFNLAQGQSVVAWAQAYTLMSPMDPVLRLLGPGRRQVAWNHDDGRSLDPLLAWTSATGGNHVLQFFTFPYPADSDIRLSGKPHAVYRLHIHAGPLVRHALPLGVQRGQTNVLALVGWNLGAASNNPVLFDASSLPPETTTTALIHQGLPALVNLFLGDGPEGLESEPNDDVAQAQPLPVPGAFTGNLDREGDIDRFTLKAAKGDKLLLAVHSASLGFNLDAWLRVEDAHGKELARNDDGHGSDPRLEWTAPSDGSFVVAVGSLLRLGGTDRWYRLSAMRPAPAFRPTVAENAFSIAPGKTLEIAVSLGRIHGHDAPLTLSIDGLPEGLNAERVEADAKATSATLRLVAATHAPAAAVPFRIRVAEKAPGRSLLAQMDLVSAGENNGVPQGFRRLVRDSIDDLWLTVSAPKAEK